VGIWFCLWNWKVKEPVFAYNYERVVSHGEWWRCVSASFTHTAVLHIFFNMFFLWNTAPVEAAVGSVTYCKWTFVLLCGSMAAIVGTEHVLITRWPASQEHRRRGWSLGYSAIAFGWMSFWSVVGTGSFSLFGVVSFPSWIAPFASLILTQVMVPNASFIGHAAGMLIGYLVGFGVFFWYDNYLFVCTFMWFAIALVHNVKTHSQWPYCPCITVDNAPDDNDPELGRDNAGRGAELRQIGVVPGVVVDASPDSSPDRAEPYERPTEAEDGPDPVRSAPAAGPAARS
jgi:membrane associated rhomboid family serine protease